MEHASGILTTPFELGARQFEITLRRLADDLTYGSDPSRFVGSGTDYAQTRLYSLGDPVRAIDWKVTARTGKFHVKEYDSPKRAPVYMIADTSESMRIGSGDLTKHAAAVWIAGALALVAFRRRNPVTILSGGALESELAPTVSRAKIWRAIDALRVRSDQPEKTRLAERLAWIEATADRTSLIIIVSDLHAPEAISPIKRLGQRHDCIVIHLQDPAEHGSLHAGFLRAEEAETGAGLFARRRTTFLDAAAIDRSQDFARARVDYIRIRTDEPVVRGIRRALSMRGGARVAR